MCSYELVLYFKNGSKRTYFYSRNQYKYAFRRCRRSKTYCVVYYCVDGVRERVACFNDISFEE